MILRRVHIDRTRPAAPVRGGSASVSALLFMVLLAFVTVGLLAHSARDADLSTHRLDSTRAMYASESGLNMALREMMLGVDEDGDGAVGTISDDGSDMTDPVLGSARVVVSRVDVGDEATLTTAGRSGAALRTAEATVEIGKGVGAPFEIGAVDAGAFPTTVDLMKTYTSPVVVCTPNYDNNARPIVVRVDNVTATSFDVRLQNPGDGATPVTDRVWYIVMEEGAHTMDGVDFEAQTYLSTQTDRKSGNNWSGEAQTYLQTYTDPVVVGQVMTRNDPDWSVFWCRGNSKSNAPNASTLWTGKHVGEDSDVTRSTETVGFIVFERGSGTIAGVAMDATVSAKNVRGINNSPPFFVPFTSTMSTAPEFVASSIASMNGGDGGWANVYGSAPTSTAGADTVIDEDQVGDSDRSHTNEYVSVLAFESMFTAPALLTWSEIAP